MGIGRVIAKMRSDPALFTVSKVGDVLAHYDAFNTEVRGLKKHTINNYKSNLLLIIKTANKGKGDRLKTSLAALNSDLGNAYDLPPKLVPTKMRVLRV